MSSTTNGKTKSDPGKQGPRFKNQGCHIRPKGKGMMGTSSQVYAYPTANLTLGLW
jgi:hypothetical protein